jgi:hypothetical protein
VERAFPGFGSTIFRVVSSPFVGRRSVVGVPPAALDEVRDPNSTISIIIIRINQSINQFIYFEKPEQPRPRPFPRIPIRIHFPKNGNDCIQRSE